MLGRGEMLTNIYVAPLGLEGGVAIVPVVKTTGYCMAALRAFMLLWKG